MLMMMVIASGEGVEAAEWQENEMELKKWIRQGGGIQKVN